MAFLLRNPEDPINFLEASEFRDVIEELESTRREADGRVIVFPGQVIKFR